MYASCAHRQRVIRGIKGIELNNVVGVDERNWGSGGKPAAIVRGSPCKEAMVI